MKKFRCTQSGICLVPTILLVKLNCRKLFDYTPPVCIICTDASDFACGGHALFIVKEEFELFYKAFCSMESVLDSNGRELLAILYALKSFKSLIQGKVVKLFTDSKNASIISTKGSMSLRLQCQALEIFQFCAVNNVSVEFDWVPRSLNEYADSLSRVIDFDNWSVSAAFFDHVCSPFGPFTVDRFASPDSAKCARFYSKFWCPGAEGVDAFSVDWAGENNWLVPPVYLISRVIFHLEVCSARGVLVVPKWPSAVFWSIIFPVGGHRASVNQVIEFTDPSFVFAPAREAHNTIFCPFRFKSAVLAVYLDVLPVFSDLIARYFLAPSPLRHLRQLSLGKRTFRFSGTALFNSLPCKIQKAVSLSSFKNLVKAHFIYST